MNHVLMYRGGRDEDREYYISSVRRHDDKFMARGKRVSLDGRLIQTCAGFIFPTIPEAETKCRDLVKTKVKHGHVVVTKENVPECVVKHFEAPPDMQVTTEELVKMIAEAKRERYVVFKDTTGIEAFFDAGVQYLGYSDDEKEEYFKVYDRFGEQRECMAERIEVSVLTERAIEAQEIARRMGR